ncbi:MAG: hypothetical protein P4L35_08750, partial [Ignavibacteriaceae bacterium]|nr:hypothetical protein [Ignavibacteriaceae bacterium]
TEILLMKAVSHYALTEEAQTRKCFIDMLKIDRHLELDSEKVSPKIVSLFKEVKNDFLQTIPEEQKITDTRQVNSDPASNELILSKMQDQKNSIVRSFLFPGWGQIYTGNTTKGIIISSAAVLNLGAMIYFIVDANAKQKKYLNATSADIINSSYNSYNRSYITRNVLISSMILIYAYAQVDFLVLGGNGPPEIKLGLGENSSNPGGSGIAFNLKMSL